MGGPFQGPFKWLRGAESPLDNCLLLAVSAGHGSFPLGLLDSCHLISSFRPRETGSRYCMPSNADTVLCIDPEKQEMKTIGGPLEGDWKWHGGNLGDEPRAFLEVFFRAILRGWEYLRHPCECHPGRSHKSNKSSMLCVRCLEWILAPKRSSFLGDLSRAGRSGTGG